MRVLQMINSAKWTGAADPALAVSRHLIDRGHEVLFCIRGGRSLERMAGRLGVPVHTGLRMEDGLRLRSLAADVRDLADLVRRGGFQVVHTHLSHDHWTAALAIRRFGLGVALVRSNHKTAPLRWDPWHRLLVGRWTDAIIDVSKRTAELHRRRLGEGRAFWVHGGVDVEFFRPDIDGGPGRRQLGIGAEPVAGIISHLHPDRGHRDLLPAFVQVLRAVPEAKLLIIGRGSYEPALRRMVERLGLVGSVIFPRGFVDRWRELLAVLDVSIYLAEGSEGSGRAMLEAMAMGKPLVAADVGVVPETVEDGVTGIIVPPGDRARIASALVELLGDPGRRTRMGRAARSLVERSYTQQIRAEAVERVYEEILKRKTHGGRCG